MLHLILSLMLGIINPPTIKETQDRVLHVQFDAGATQVCVYLQRQVKEEVSSSTNDEGYYTPQSCFDKEATDGETFLDDDIWNMVMPWFEDHKVEPARWLYWAVIEYPTTDGKYQYIPTEVHEVVR